MKVPYSYLDKQFGNPDWIWEKRVRDVVAHGDFTLGKELQEFETRFAKFVGVKHAIGVNSGTDALFLPLKALGIGPGDEVITHVNTFVATAGAIVQTGAKPVFVDSVENNFVLDPDKIEEAITPNTKAILPVHYTGQPCDMGPIKAIANKHRLPIIEDACQAIQARTAQGEPCGGVGLAGGFSLHPLKNLNVWGDGGVITTNDDSLMKELKLLRNHGMVTRDDYEFYSYNSRLDTVQSAVANCILDLVPDITATRIKHAQMYDQGFKGIPQITVPKRVSGETHCYHLYMLLVKHRDDLLRWLQDHHIECKVHYPKPLHLQKASRYLGYKKGDFPVAERHGEQIISLPVHQGLDELQIKFVIDKTVEFYKNV